MAAPKVFSSSMPKQLNNLLTGPYENIKENLLSRAAFTFFADGKLKKELSPAIKQALSLHALQKPISQTLDKNLFNQNTKNAKLQKPEQDPSPQEPKPGVSSPQCK